MKKINKTRSIGPVVEIIILILLVSVLSLVFNLFKVSGFITEGGTFETSLVVVNNIFSSEGLAHILNSTLANFQLLEPLILIILSLIATSILEASGLLKHIFTPLRNIKPVYVTAIVMFIGIISTIIGDYSYALLLPIVGILYKYIGRSSSLGVLTMFIAITIGYGTGIIYNYQFYQLGDITELAASGIIKKYNYELLSNIGFLIVSTLILGFSGTFILEKFAKKHRRNDDTDNLNISKKAAKITIIAFIAMILLLVYCIIPGLPKSGMLLDLSEPTYIGKLFSSTSPLSQGFLVLTIIILMLCGFIYGKVSKNIKNSNDYSNALTRTFENTGTIFVLLFFASILYEIIEWTNLFTVISTNIIDFIGSTQLSGLILLIVVFISIIIISITIPGSIDKWQLIAPIYVPLLIRANISPAFAQTLFQAADSIGKLVSPIYVYLIVTIGFMHKFEKNSNISIFDTLQRIMPIILKLALVWVVIVFGWYLVGIPIGINSTITL